MIPAALVLFAAFLLLMVPARAQAGEMKLQGFLLWGTNESKPPPDKKYQPADPDVRQRLKDFPLKCTNWFEVRRVEFPVVQDKVNEAAMSEKCRVQVRQMPGSEVEVALIGKGKEVVKRKQTLPKGEFLVLGGNAPNATAWLVVLKRIE